MLTDSIHAVSLRNAEFSEPGPADRGAGAAGPPRMVMELVLPTVRSRFVFTLAAVFVAVIYTVLFPFAFTQRFGFGNWRYLTPLMGALSIAYGIGLAWVVACQVAAIRSVTRARGEGLGVVGAVAGVLPSLLCCTPVVPTVLGVFGMSGVSLITTSGHIQSFFGRNETWIELGGFAVLVASAVWSVHKLRTAVCITGRCAIVTTSACSDGPKAVDVEIATSPRDVDTKIQGFGTQMGESTK